MIKIAFYDAGIRPQASRLDPPGKHVFLAEPPQYLNEKLEYPYMATVVFRMNRPTGGSSWNPIVRRSHDKRFRKHSLQFLEAVRWLERMVNGWEKTSAHSAPLFIAQAKDLLWYMSKEIASPELTTLYDAERLITPNTAWSQLCLLNLILDVREYIDRVATEASQQAGEDRELVLSVQRTSAAFLLQLITQRFEHLRKSGIMSVG